MAERPRHFAATLRAIVCAVALVVPAADPLRAQNLPTGWDQGLFELRVPGNAALTVPALVNPEGGILLPVDQVLKLTGLPEQRSRNDSIRSIPEVGGSGTSSIDLISREVRRTGLEFPLGEMDVRVIADGLYLLTDRLAEFLQADVTPDWSTLTVVIARTPPFPAQRRHEVETRRSGARDRLGAGVAPLPVIDYPSRTGGYVAEWSVSTSSQEVLRAFGAQMRFGMAVAGGDLSVGTIYTALSSPEYGRLHATTSYRRAFPTWSTLRQLEAGDIVIGGATYQAVRGVNVTNARTVRDQFFTTLPVEPTVPIGWEYEVYQNGQLIGYSDAATRGAIGVPLRYGTTPVQLRLLSPAGEEVLSDLSFLVPPSLIQPGRFEYATGAGQCSTTSCGGLAYLDLKYGLRQWLTIGGGAQHLWDLPGSRFQPYASANYGDFSGWQAELQGARDLFSRIGVAYYGLAPLNGSISAGLNSPGIGRASYLGAVAQRWHGEVRVARRLAPGTRIGNALRFEARSEGQKNEGADHLRLSAFADQQRGSYGLHLEDDKQASGGILTLSMLKVLPARGPRWMHYTAITTEAGFRGAEFQAFDVSSSIRVARTSALGLSARWDARQRAASASASLNSSLGFARSTTRAIASPGRSASATTALSGVATFDPPRTLSTYEFGGIGMAGVGGVVFYDYDGDGKLGPADSVAPDIGLIIGGQRRRTDARGRYRAWNVVPYELVEIAVDTLRGMPPNWIPFRVQQYVRATPHMYNRFDIALAQTREVSGRIVADSGIWTSSGITVLFENVETGATTSTVTFSDGAFYVSRMRPGRYEMSVSPAALEALGARASVDKVPLDIPVHAGDEIIEMTPVMVTKPAPVEQAVVVQMAPKCPGVAPGTPVDSLGCPILFTKRVLTLRGVTFELNKSELTPSSFDVLDSIAEALKDSPEIQIEIAGHTDATGSRERNLALSTARAAAVRAHFIARGVDSTRMIVRGYGPDQPVASNRTEAGRALNRRTELRRLDEPADSARVVPDSLKALPSAEYSVETGSFRTLAAATRLRDRLVTLGFDARLLGDSAPFRVRVGRVATRREASSLATRLKGRGVGGSVVRAELP